MRARESLIIVDKPPGPTSFDVVRRVKKQMPGVKVGHTGSLDPFASGVLVLLVGRATKLSGVLLNADKSYRAVVKLGEATDSMDRTGEIVDTKPVPELSFEKVAEVVKGFEGTWEQTPPMFSAKKIRGVRLYELARQQIHVRREPVPVQLHEMKPIAYEAPYVHFEVSCSKGTYIRSLAAEIGERLGTVGHLHVLRRLSVGPFLEEESVSMEDLEEKFDECYRAGFSHYGRFVRSEQILRRGASGELTQASPQGSSLGSSTGVRRDLQRYRPGGNRVWKKNDEKVSNSLSLSSTNSRRYRPKTETTHREGSKR